MVGYNAFATAAPLVDKMVSCGFVTSKMAVAKLPDLIRRGAPAQQGPIAYSGRAGDARASSQGQTVRRLNPPPFAVVYTEI